MPETDWQSGRQSESDMVMKNKKGFTKVVFRRGLLKFVAAIDTEKIRDAIAGTNLKSGEKGNINGYDIRFDAKGRNARASVVSGEIVDQKFTHIFPTRFAEKKAVFPAPRRKDMNLQM